MTDNNTVAAESNTAAPGPPAQAAPVSRWTAVVWVLPGVLLGVVAMLVYTQLFARPALQDAAAIRVAAREGALEAIATLQSGGSPAESRVTSTPVAKTAFAVRPANQIGASDAPVTIVEFSDFQ